MNAEDLNLQVDGIRGKVIEMTLPSRPAIQRFVRHEKSALQ